MGERLRENKPNIILITIDCLRADHLKYLHKLIKRKRLVCCTNFFSNGTFTPLSIPCMLSSIYPPLETPQRTITHILKENGYNTAGFVPNAILLDPRYRISRIDKGFDFYNTYLMENPQSNFKRGFNKFSMGIRDMIRLLFGRETKLFEIMDVFKVIPIPFEIWLPYPRAEQIFADARTKIEELGKPYFLWLHLMDAHSPYFPPENYRSIDEKIMKALNLKLLYHKHWRSREDVNLLHRLYIDELRYLDDCLDEFLDAVMEENIYVIVTADHGEQFMEHGGLEHISWCMYEEQIRIPLIILNNDSGEKSFIASTIDIAPTIADLTGIDHGFLGQSILGDNYVEKPILIVGLDDKKKPIYGIRTKRWKLFEGITGWELYDLTRDPHEKQNLYEEEKTIAMKLKNQIEKIKGRKYTTMKEIEKIRQVASKLKR